MTEAALKNREPVMRPPAGGPTGFSLIWPLLIIVGAACLACTNDSFWIDECISTEFAKHRTLAETWTAMRTFPEVQLPLYMLYLWICAHLFGTEEWVLRAVNLPWFITGATVFVAYISRAVGSAVIPALLIAWSAFVWYYLNEARVYSAQLGFALALIGSAAGILQSIVMNRLNRVCWRLFLISLFLLCGTSVLGAVWGFFFFGGFLLMLGSSDRLRLLRLAPGSAAACGVGLAALAGYYAWTMTLSSKPAPGATTPQTMVFVFYELLGAAGLGPGRFDLRAVGPSAVKPFVAPLLLFAGVVMIIFWRGLREMAGRFGRRKLVIGILSVAVPLLLLCFLGVSTSFRVLGRHATPVLPFVLLILGFGIVSLSRRRGGGGKLIVGTFLLLSLGSSLAIRFARRHEKDDYRSAAAIARVAVANDYRVWWNAAPSGAAYYNLSEDSGEEQGQAGMKILVNPTRPQIEALPPPDLIITSKKDAYDNSGAVETYAMGRNYRADAGVSAFIIWTRAR